MARSSSGSLSSPSSMFFFRLVFSHHKTYLDGLVHDPDQQARDRAGQARLQPVTGVVVAHADRQHFPIEAKPPAYRAPRCRRRRAASPFAVVPRTDCQASCAARSGGRFDVHAASLHRKNAPFWRPRPVRPFLRFAPRSGRLVRST